MVQPDKPAERMMTVLAMPLSHRQARVLAVIAYHDGPGGARPSLAKIACEAGLKHRARASETVGELVDLGVLKRRHGKHANTYEVIYAWQPQCPRKADSVEDQPVPHSVQERRTVRPPCLSVRDSQSTVSANPGHEPEEPESRTVSGGTASSPPQIPSPPSTPIPNIESVAAREGASVGHPPAPDPDAPPWQLPLVRTISGGRTDEKKGGMQADGGSADIEATLESLQPSKAQGARRIDDVLRNLGESILTKRRAQA